MLGYIVLYDLDRCNEHSKKSKKKRMRVRARACYRRAFLTKVTA